jgi:uncharacterized protein YfaA (DUF2138 family)
MSVLQHVRRKYTCSCCNNYIVTANKLVDKNITQQWVLEAKEHTVSRINFIRQIFIARSFTTDLKINSKQLLLLASQSDRLVNVASSKALAKNTGADLKMNALAGHEITLDDPVWVIDQAASFFHYSL